MTFTFVPQQEISNRSWYKSRLINLSGEWRLAVHWLQRIVVCIARKVINKMVEEEELGYIILYKAEKPKKILRLRLCVQFSFSYTLPLRFANPRYSCPLIFLILSCFSARGISLKYFEDKRLKLSEQIFLSPRGSNQSPSACETKAITMRYLDIWLVASNSVNIYIYIARIRLWCILLFPHSLTVHPVGQTLLCEN